MVDQQTQRNKKSFIRKILKSQLLYSLLAGLCLWLMFVIDFLSGYREFPLHVLLFPAGLISLLFAAIFTLIVLIRALWSVIRLRNIIRSIVFALLVVAFWFTPRWFLPKFCPERPFMLGFRNRVLKLSSPQELHGIAAKARILLNEEKHLPGPGRIWLPEKKEKYSDLWKKIPESKLFTSHNSRVCISVSDNNDVEIFWGGALIGHWGIRISDYPLERKTYDNEFVSIEPNLVLFFSQ